MKSSDGSGSDNIHQLLTNKKMTPIEKQNTWVLVSKGDIVWVVGKRADDRFKVTDYTKTILKIEWQ